MTSLLLSSGLSLLWLVLLCCCPVLVHAQPPLLLDNVRIDRRNRLLLVARQESYAGPALMDDQPGYDPTDTRVTQPYTSARIVTRDKFDFRYGRVEVSARLAGGQGVWPAIWMLPSSPTETYGIWPLSGEVDIVEAVNLQTDKNPQNTVEGSLHYGMPWPQWKVNFQRVILDENPADRYHVYAMEWGENERGRKGEVM